MNKVKLAIILVLVAVGAIIVLQNTAEVETHILWYTVAMPRALLLLVTGIVGFAIGVITCLGFSGRK